MPPDSRSRWHVGRFELAGLTVVGLCFAAADLDAYIDPGTGSYLFQLGAAGIFAALFTVKRYWARIRQALRRPGTGMHESEAAGAITDSNVG